MKTDRPKPTGLIRIVNAFGNTWKGYVGAFREEAAFRQELALCLVLFPLGLWLGESGVERGLPRTSGLRPCSPLLHCSPWSGRWCCSMVDPKINGRRA
jgi:hypothetical protein